MNTLVCFQTMIRVNEKLGLEVDPYLRAYVDSLKWVLTYGENED